MPARISQGLKRLLAPARSIPTMPWSAQGGTWSWPRPPALVVLLAGLWLFGIGEAALIDASLGNTPWTVLAEGIADHSRLGIGGATIVIGAPVLVGWVPPPPLPGIGTIANVVVIGGSPPGMQPPLPPPPRVPPPGPPAAARVA